MGRKIILVGLMAIWLTACGGERTAVVTGTLSPTLPPVTKTATLDPTKTPLATEMFTPTQAIPPTLTPTPTPITYVRQGTPVVQPAEAISAENIDRLVELARWGRGAIIDVQLSPGGDYFYVLTTQELIAYETRSQEELWKYVEPVGLTGMDVQPAGVLIALGTLDGRVVLVDRLPGEVVTTFQMNSEKINALAFSLDGKRIGSGSNDSYLRVWNVEDASFEWEDNFDGETIEQILFSAEGKTVIVALEKSFEFLDSVQGTRIGSEPASNRGNQRYLSPNGRFVSDGISMWDAQSGETLYRINHEYEDFGTSAAIFSPDSILFALSYKGEDSIEIRRVSDGELVHTLVAPFNGNLSESGSIFSVPSGGPGPGGALSLAFSPDGKTLAANLDGVTVIWDVISGKVLNWVDDSGELFYSKGGDRLIFWWEDGISQFGLAKKEIVHTTSGFLATWSSNTLITVDGRWLLVGDAAWDLSKGTRAFNFGNEIVEAISPEGNIIYLGKSNGSVILREVGEFNVLDEFIPLLPAGYSSQGYAWYSVPSISPTGEHMTNYFVENRDDGPHKIGLYTYDFASDAFISQLSIDDGEYYTQAIYSSDGTMLAYMNYDDFDLYQIKPDFAPIRGEHAKESLFDAAFSPDGTLVAITGYEKATIYLIEKNVGYSEYFTWEQDGWSYLLFPVFSPDNQLFLFSDRYGNISVIDLNLGEKIAQFNPDFNGLMYLAFSPDGRYLVTVSDDGTIRLWGIAP